MLSIGKLFGKHPLEDTLSAFLAQKGDSRQLSSFQLFDLSSMEQLIDSTLAVPAKISELTGISGIQTSDLDEILDYKTAIDILEVDLSSLQFSDGDQLVQASKTFYTKSVVCRAFFGSSKYS